MEGGHIGDDLEPIPIQVDERGRFEFTATLGHTIKWEEVDGKRVDTGEVWDSEHFLFRAQGCEDHIILVDGTWQPQEVRLTCEAKTE
mgnify:CR=1 FL=1